MLKGYTEYRPEPNPPKPKSRASYQRQWHREHPEKQKEYTLRHFAKKLGVNLEDIEPPRNEQ